MNGYEQDDLAKAINVCNLKEKERGEGSEMYRAPSYCLLSAPHLLTNEKTDDKNNGH